MQRIVSLSVEELAFDPKAAAALLDNACGGRRQHYRVNGCCQVGETVFFPLLPIPDSDAPTTYVLAPVHDLSSDGITAMLEERWAAGFDPLGMVCLGDDDEYLAVFARQQGRNA